jgi:hypothetical protein
MPWRLILRTAVNWHGEKEGEPLAYVGESEDIGSHIKSHDAAKDWGSMAVLVTTAGNNLNTITRLWLWALSRHYGRV